MATIYLLHLDTPLAHARHYVGVADDLDARLGRHAAGNGARMLAVCVERGITWRLARTWQGDRRLERQLKNRRNAPKLCAICSGAAALKRAANYDTKKKEKNR